MSWPWSGLGLPGPASLTEIRRAYAEGLKSAHPEEDPEGFQRLHAAYREASRLARQSPEAPAFPQEYSQPDSGQPPENAEGAGVRGTDEVRAKAAESQPEKSEATRAPKTGPAADWDYERLFAEGEAEAREARRRKLEELRQKNHARYAAQEREQRRRAADEEEAWSAVMAAVHALELLYSTGAPLPHWQRFLNAPVFWNVRANLDFIFALEDFLERNPDLSPDIRKAIFAAYGFEKGPGNPACKRLCRLLNVAPREKRRLRRAKSPWRTWPRSRRFAAVFGVALLGVMSLVAFWDLIAGAGAAMRSLFKPDWEITALEWLEEDFGEPFVSAGHDNLFAPESAPGLYFWLARDGERTDDWPGYRTDYPHIRVMAAMEDFAEDWGLGLRFDGANGGYSGAVGDAPGAYLFDLPLLGAGEAITALGAELETLQVQRWYRVLEDQYNGAVAYQIFLCHRGLSFYDAVSTGGGFDADYARARYETQAGPAFCRYLAEETGLAASHMGEDAYVLLDQGGVEIDGETFFHVTGLSKDGYEPLAHYLLSASGGVLFCLPDGGLERLTAVTDLYRGTPRHFDLDPAGLVLAWDQIQ